MDDLSDTDEMHTMMVRVPRALLVLCDWYLAQMIAAKRFPVRTARQAMTNRLLLNFSHWICDRDTHEGMRREVAEFWRLPLQEAPPTATGKGGLAVRLPTDAYARIDRHMSRLKKAGKRPEKYSRSDAIRDGLNDMIRYLIAPTDEEREQVRLCSLVSWII